jgi:hypothetical protein
VTVAIGLFHAKVSALSPLFPTVIPTHRAMAWKTALAIHKVGLIAAFAIIAESLAFLRNFSKFSTIRNFL